MIKFVSKEKITEVIHNYCNNIPIEKDKYITVDGNSFIAVDNSTGDAWTEEFPTMKDAIDWLNNKFEMSEYRDRMKANA